MCACIPWGIDAHTHISDISDCHMHMYDLFVCSFICLYLSIHLYIDMTSIRVSVVCACVCVCACTCNSIMVWLMNLMWTMPLVVYVLSTQKCEKMWHLDPDKYNMCTIMCTCTIIRAFVRHRATWRKLSGGNDGSYMLYSSGIWVIYQETARTRRSHVIIVHLSASIWVNCNISLTWIKAIGAWFPF